MSNSASAPGIEDEHENVRGLPALFRLRSGGLHTGSRRGLLPSFKMLSFVCDYLEGAHPKILEGFLRPIWSIAGLWFRPVLNPRRRTGSRWLPEADIYFRRRHQTNSVIAGMLRGFEGVVAARTGHQCPRKRAVEYTGHKILSLPEQDNKMVREVRAFLETFS